MIKAKPQYFAFFKPSYVPLFASRIFVQMTPSELHRIETIYEVINLVHWLKEPVTVKNEEIDSIKKFLSIYNDVSLEKIPLGVNNPLPVVNGSLIRQEKK